MRPLRNTCATGEAITLEPCAKPNHVGEVKRPQCRDKEERFRCKRGREVEEVDVDGGDRSGDEAHPRSERPPRQPVRQQRHEHACDCGLDQARSKRVMPHHRVHARQIERCEVGPVRSRLTCARVRPPIGIEGEAIAPKDILGEAVIGDLVVDAREGLHLVAHVQGSPDSQPHAQNHDAPEQAPVPVVGIR